MVRLQSIERFIAYQDRRLAPDGIAREALLEGARSYVDFAAAGTSRLSRPLRPEPAALANYPSWPAPTDGRSVPREGRAARHRRRRDRRRARRR